MLFKTTIFSALANPIISKLESFLLTFNVLKIFLNTSFMKKLYPLLGLLAISFFFSFSLAAQNTGVLSLVDSAGSSVANYAQGSSLFINVSDADRNASATAADTLSVLVSSTKET